MANQIVKKQQKHYSEKDEWEKKLDNFDRSQRRRETQWRRRVVRIDAILMAAITGTNRKINLDKMNNLDPEAGF